MKQSAKVKAKTPAEYLEMLPEDRKKELTALHRLIRKAAPKLKPHMAHDMIGYGTYHYKYASGREGDWPLLALSSRANYISLYVCAVENGKYVSDAYRKQLPKADIGKSCVRFKRLEDVDLKVVEKMIRHAAKVGGAGAV